MKRESKTQYALLGILSQCEMNGYEIRKYIETTISFFWNESFGQIYPTLKRLEEEGLIREFEKKEDSGKTKKVYKITKAGLTEFKNWMESSEIQQNKRNEVLFKVFFGRHMEKSQLLTQLDSQVKRNNEDLVQLKQLRKELEVDWDTHPDHSYWKLTLEYAEKLANLNLEWLSKVEKQVKSAK